MRKKRVTLKYHCRIAPVRGKGVDPYAADEHIAAGWSFKTGHHAQDCRLATTGRSQQCDKFTRLDVEGNIIDGSNLFTAGPIEDFDKIIYDDIFGF